nr:hypothetical protein Iba_chr11cCG12970 [Ipomoea batatas]
MRAERTRPALRLVYQAGTPTPDGGFRSSAWVGPSYFPFISDQLVAMTKGFRGSIVVGNILPTARLRCRASRRPIVTLVNDVPSIFGRVSNSNPKVTYEDIALLLKKFKKFLGAYRKQGSSSKKSSLADAKVRWYKPTIEDYENLSYNCKKLGQFKVDFAHQEKESKEKKDNRIRRDKSVDKNKDMKG